MWLLEGFQALWKKSVLLTTGPSLLYLCSIEPETEAREMRALTQVCCSSSASSLLGLSHWAQQGSEDPPSSFPAGDADDTEYNDLAAQRDGALAS